MSSSLDFPTLEKRLADWMRKAQGGDSSAYRELLLEVRPILKNYMQRGLRRMGIRDLISADDLTQDTLLALHSKRDTYDPALLFTPWIFAIARYKLIDSGRKRRHEAPIEDLSFFDSIPAPESGAPDRRAGPELERLLEALPSKQREVLRLAKIQGLSMEEVARSTGMSVANAKVSIHRAIKTLRAKFRKDADSS